MNEEYARFKKHFCFINRKDIGFRRLNSWLRFSGEKKLKSEFFSACEDALECCAEVDKALICFRGNGYQKKP